MEINKIQTVQNSIEQNLDHTGLPICLNSTLKTISYLLLMIFYFVSKSISSESGNYVRGILSEASNSMLLCTILGGVTFASLLLKLF